jgi:acyl-coenzyme A synthetase/AMP-(fatty) acid ligase/acyl carrier protein
MCDWFIVNQITVCFMQTPLAQLLLDMGLLKQLRLRSLQVGGDRLPAANWNALPYPVFNLYGPTEITVVSAWTCVDSSELPAIGRPVANTRLYVLDGELSLLPAGVSGELYIGGAGLARGYLKQGGLTAGKFIPDLYGDVPGARLYRTGDLVRWRPDGRLDWIGRLDQQTKIRGYRIELGEIEVALSLHRSVRECAVLALEAEGKQKQLVGYWVKKNESPGVGPDELRRHLHELLPAYMVPAAFVELEEFPRMPSGKIDRVLLMRRDEMKSAISSREYIGPGTQHEKTLAEIWCNLLGLKQVGIKDDFIQLGGDSLLLMRMLSKIKELYKIGLPRRNMLVDLTIEKMASAIDQELTTAGAASVAPIARRARQI